MTTRIIFTVVGASLGYLAYQLFQGNQTPTKTGQALSAGAGAFAGWKIGEFFAS